MTKIISLTRILYKINKNDSSKMSKQKKFFLYLILYAYLLFIFYSFWKLFITPLKDAGEVSKFIELFISIGSIFIFAIGITSVANIMYFSSDIQNLLPLPFKSIEIYTAKLITSYLYLLTIDFTILFPAVIAYGTMTNSNLIFYLYAIIVILLIPVIPIILIAFIYSVIMPFIKFVKYKNVFRVIATIAILALILGFQLKLNLNVTENGKYSAEYILNLANSLSSKVPYIKPAVSALNNLNNFYGVISLVLFVFINFFAFSLLIFICNGLYMKGIVANLNGEEKILHRKKNKVLRKKSQFIALIEKDFKNLFRNVTFFIQCLFPSFLMPIIVIAISLINNNNISEMLPEERGETKIIFGMIMIQFFMLMNFLSITAISRDGKIESIYLKSLPISSRKQLIAKAMPGIMIGTMQLIISIYFVYKIISLNLYEITILLICGILLNFIQSFMSVIIDLKHPKIYWESEIAVVKHNMNLLYFGLLGLLNIFITAIFGLISNFIGFSLPYIMFLLVLTGIIFIYVYKKSDDLYSKVI